MFARNSLFARLADSASRAILVSSSARTRFVNVDDAGEADRHAGIVLERDLGGGW